MPRLIRGVAAALPGVRLYDMPTMIRARSPAIRRMRPGGDDDPRDNLSERSGDAAKALPHTACPRFNLRHGDEITNEYNMTRG
jgi:hypothetical protein